jgi:D-lactate dehydrogenase (cytochrome)
VTVNFGVTVAELALVGNVDKDHEVVRAQPVKTVEKGVEVEVLVPGIRPLPFGHLGDGNLHFNFQAPEGPDDPSYLERSSEVHAIVYRHVLAMAGSISAEHGIGQVKRAQLAETKDPVALELMRTLKNALDPEGRMNPGKVL